MIKGGIFVVFLCWMKRFVILFCLIWKLCVNVSLVSNCCVFWFRIESVGLLILFFGVVFMVVNWFSCFKRWLLLICSVEVMELVFSVF